MALDDGEKGRAVFLQLGDADAVNGGELVEIVAAGRAAISISVRSGKMT